MKNSQKGSAIIWVLVVVVVVVVILAGFILRSKNNNVVLTPTHSPTPTHNTATPTPPTSIYTNRDYGFQLTLPGSWAGYKVTKNQLMNNAGATLNFLIPGAYGSSTALTITVLDKQANKALAGSGTYFASSPTMDFYASYPTGAAGSKQVVSTFKLTQ